MPVLSLPVVVLTVEVDVVPTVAVNALAGITLFASNRPDSATGTP